MNLLDRYLQAVARCLPKSRRGDIIEELRTNLLSQIEDQEEELGRTLSEDELAAILQRHGNPTTVAGRYGEHNYGLAFGLQIIGPELFPIYRSVLGLIFGITIVLLAGVAFILSKTTHETITLARLLTPLPIQFVVTTLIFALIDRGKNHVLNQWDPRQLPAVRKDSEDGPTASKVFNFLALLVGTVWLAVTPHWPFLLLGPGAFAVDKLALKMMPSWPEFYWAIIAVLCASLVVELLKVFRKMPRQRTRIVGLTLKCAGFVIGVLLLLAGPNYVTSDFKDAAEWANQIFYVSLIVWLAISIGGIARLILSLVRERHQMLPARQH